MSARARSVAVVAVGDELLEGDHPDTNSGEIARALLEVGREAARFLVLRDDEEALARELAHLCTQHGTVIVTGGLGPTLDDVTRHAVARAAGVPLEVSSIALAQVRDWFARSKRTMAVSNERQALIPTGARLIANPRGTAPGFEMEIGGALVFALPGPPREMRGMLEERVLPRLRERRVDGWVRAARSFYLFDLSESHFADRAGAWMDRCANPLMSVTAKSGVLSVRCVANAATGEAARSLLDERCSEFRERFGSHLFSEESGALEFALGRELLERSLSVTLAESCTGGLIAAALTRVPGISAVLREAFVAYSDEAKEARLGVPRALLERHGAVSAEVASAMASGAALASTARLGLAVTGIAGPGGDGPEKPIGLVFFATFLDGRAESHERRFPQAGRDQIRDWATNVGLGLLWRRARESH